MYYSQSESSSRLLAARLKQNESFSTIDATRTTSGSITHDPDDINNTFRSFYSHLYTAESIPNLTALKSYLSELNLPSLTNSEAEQLEVPLTLSELKEALNLMQKAKSPGLDGLPTELFLELWDIIGLLLLDSINFALNTGSFHRDQNTSLISVLLKKGKPPLRCGSYRPISLITTELKLFAKVLVRRLERFVGKLIHHDQTGFLKGRLASDNIRQLFTSNIANLHPIQSVFWL